MVAMNVWPTDAADGSVANEARWRAMARHWTSSGVLLGVGNAMAPSLAFPNLTIQAGACWVDGHFCELTGSQVLTATADGLAVVRFDPAANLAELVWRAGATTPARAPTGTWELPIASVAGSALTDTRPLILPNGGVGFANRAGRAKWTTWSPPPLGAVTTLNDWPGLVHVWDGNGWAVTQTGRATLSTDANSNIVWTYPKPFTAAPAVMAQGDGTSSVSILVHPLAGQVSAASANLVVRANNGTTYPSTGVGFAFSVTGYS